MRSTTNTSPSATSSSNSNHRRRASDAVTRFICVQRTSSRRAESTPCGRPRLQPARRDPGDDTSVRAPHGKNRPRASGVWDARVLSGTRGVGRRHAAWARMPRRAAASETSASGRGDEARLFPGLPPPSSALPAGPIMTQCRYSGRSSRSPAGCIARSSAGATPAASPSSPSPARHGGGRGRRDRSARTRCAPSRRRAPLSSYRLISGRAGPARRSGS